MMAGLRSGQVAAAAGVNLQTLRYYERRGLLAEPERSLGGHRIYPEQAVTVLRVIKAAQRLGFTLDEIAKLIEAGRHHHGQRADAGLWERARGQAHRGRGEDRRPASNRDDASRSTGCRVR
jgi:MerR family mercuric resistance operon transcriptional regulator